MKNFIASKISNSKNSEESGKITSKNNNKRKDENSKLGQLSKILNGSSPKRGIRPFQSESRRGTLTSLLTDQEILNIGIDYNQVSEYRRQLYRDKFEMENWYEILKEHTIKSRILPLEFQEITSLIECFQKSEDSTEYINNQKNLENLKEKMKSILKEDQQFHEKGCFIKVNAVSGRDAFKTTQNDPENATFKNLVKNEISKVDVSSRNENIQTIQFIKATLKFVQVKNENDALNVILSSKDIHEELKRSIQFGENFFSCNITFREWHEEICDNPQNEFRCFISENKLNAISQYHYYVYFQSLAEQKEKIQNSIQSIFEKIYPKLASFSNYIMDIHISDYDDDKNFTIIELNPFHTTTDSGLFDWKNNEEQLKNGPFEFRILENLITSPFEVLNHHWREFLKDQFPPKAEEIEFVQKNKKSFLSWESLGTGLLFSIVVLFGVYKYTTYLNK